MRLKRYALIKSFSVFEILLFTVLIGILLFILFPGWYLDILLKKNNNYNTNLQTKYLEYLIKKRPKFEYFKLLIYDYMITGRTLEVLRLLNFLERKYPRKVQDINYLLFKYKILKTIYFSLKDSSLKRKLKSDIKELLLTLLAKANTSIKTLDFIYSQSLEFGFTDIAYKAAFRLAFLTKKTLWIKRAILLATSIKSSSKKDIESLINLANLQNFDSQTLKVVVDFLFYVVKDYRKTYEILDSYLKKEKSLPKNLQSIYLYLAIYNGNISNIYNFIASIPISDRKKMIELAIRYAFAMKKIDLAKQLIAKYALSFPTDYNYITFILKYSLATGDPFFARQISLKIMRVLKNE